MKWIYRKEIIPAFFVVIGLTIFGLMVTTNEIEKYKKNGIITNAFVTGYEHDYKGRLELRYNFFVDNKMIKGSTSFPELKGGAEVSLLNKYLPAIYLKEKPEKNELLASPQKFKNLAVTIPDSLLWLKEIERPW